MADTKITALAAIATVDPAADVLPIVDISDTSMAASGTTKKVTSNQILGAGGTATLASATITGAATVGTTLGVTGASTLASATVTGLATVGTTFAVGTVTPDIFARFYTRSIGFDSSGSTMLQINGTSYGGLDLGAAGVRTFGITASATDANISTVTNIPMIFNINNAPKMTLNTAGNLAFPSGQGIDFSATAGTGTSELLNDYEEGTFTPTISTGATAVTYDTQFGRYTKVGRLVTVYIQLTTLAATRNGSQFLIGGLPFASAIAGTGVIGYSNSGFVSTAGGNKPNMYVSGSAVEFYNSAGGSFAGTTIATDAFDVRFSATYFV